MGEKRKFVGTGGGPISLSEYDRQARELSAQAKLTVASPLELTRYGGGMHLRLKPGSTGGGGGAVNLKLVKITSSMDMGAAVPYVSDTGGPSPLCFYTGVVQVFDVTSATPWTNGDTVWWVSWYADAIVPFPGPLGPGISVVGTDGTKAHWATDSGQTYDPGLAGGNPHGLRAVWYSDAFAAMISWGCVNVGGTATMEGIVEG